MWKISALALLTAVFMAGSMQQPASARDRDGACDMRILQRNGNLNPGMPRDWVHDPVTQQWLPPNSPEARLACQHQMEINSGEQQRNSEARYNSQQRENADAERELRASGNRGCDFRILTRNGNLNPGVPRDWVHDPVTQQWLAPDSPQAVLACVHQQQVNAQQGAYNPPRDDRRDGGDR